MFHNLPIDRIKSFHRSYKIILRMHKQIFCCDLNFLSFRSRLLDGVSARIFHVFMRKSLTQKRSRRKIPFFLSTVQWSGRFHSGRTATSFRRKLYAPNFLDLITYQKRSISKNERADSIGYQRAAFLSRDSQSEALTIMGIAIVQTPVCASEAQLFIEGDKYRSDKFAPRNLFRTSNATQLDTTLMNGQQRIDCCFVINKFRYHVCCRINSVVEAIRLFMSRMFALANHISS